MRLVHHLPLSRKILLGILPLFLLSISISVLLQNSFQEREMVDQAQLSAYTHADIVRESLVSMMVNNLEVDSSFIERVNHIQQVDTLHILVNDLHLRKELLTPEREQRLARKYRLFSARDEVEQRVLENGQPEFLRTGDAFRGVVPFTATEVCQRCHAVPVGYTLGVSDIHLSFERISRAARDNWQRSLTIFLLFTVLIVAVATVMFTRFVSRPVERLVRAARDIRHGNLEHAIAGVAADSASRDEMLVLAAHFDEMRRSLKGKIGELDRANWDLSERNREIETALQRLKQAQEELVRSERLAITGKLTAQLSHEINNPIHNIQSLLESSLRKLDTDHPARELVAVALDEVSRMAKLTRQMLDFYRGSLLELEQEPVDIASLLLEVERMFRETLGRERITVAAEVKDSLPAVRGSRDKLKQVLMNLVLNARDAQPGGGRITMLADVEEGRVRIRVSDTGVGIPPEHLNRVFDAFFTTKREVSGVGLGLSVSYGIVHQHQGDIAVASTVGKGTTFTIHLPSMEEKYG